MKYIRYIKVLLTSYTQRKYLKEITKIIEDIRQNY